MSEEIEGYRIVEISNGKVKSLFHGTNGSRTIPLDTWVKAECKVARDGSCGSLYMSGWHYLPTKEDADNFFRRMFRIKKDRRVVRCKVRGNIRPKIHSQKGKCWLADEIYISSEELKQ